MKRIYLDNGATSWPKAPGLGKVMAQYIEEDCVNINRTQSEKTLDTFSWMFGLRQNICSLYNYDKPECVVFTKNVTESLNWVIKGLIKRGDKVAVSGWEHNSVMRPLVQIGANWTSFTDDYESVIKSDTKAVIINPVSNVTGRVQNLKAIAEVSKKYNCLLIIDCAQATPFFDIDFKALNAAAVCFTGHKSLLGPQGTGGFVIRKELIPNMDILMSGGSGTQSDSFELPTTMPERFTCGTENLVGLRGLSYSVDYVLNHKEELKSKIMENTKYLYKGLEKIKGISIVGPTLDEPRSNVISITCKTKDVSDLSTVLSENGVETRVGLHCSPMAHKTEGTYPCGTLRLSPGAFNTKEELDFVLKIVSDFI